MLTATRFDDRDGTVCGATEAADTEVCAADTIDLSLTVDGQPSAVTIQVVHSEGQRRSARELINRMYAWRGYGSDHRLVAAPVNTTFTASCDDDIVGTITLCVDSADGLAADKTFPDEMAQFRALPGARLCELTKLAFDANASSKPLLAALFHVIFIYGSKTFGCTDLFIEVNPRHVRFYESMLGFHRVGGLRTNDSVGAPSQLMWLKVDEIGALIARHTADRRAAAGRSLYPFFLPQGEERQVYARFAGQSAPRTMAAEAAPVAGPMAVHHVPADPAIPGWLAAAALAAEQHLGEHA